MPSFRTHVAVNLCFGLPLALLSLHSLNGSSGQELMVFGLLFCYGTFFLHPDLDLTRQVKLFSLKGFLTLPFRFYSHLFRHRGISHVPLIGTATRILWLLAAVWLACYFLEWEYPNLSGRGSVVWYGMGGIAVADFFHIVLDRFAK